MGWTLGWEELRRALWIAIGATACGPLVDDGGAETGRAEGSDGSSDEVGTSGTTATTASTATATTDTTSTSIGTTDPTTATSGTEGPPPPSCQANPEVWEETEFCIGLGPDGTCSDCSDAGCQQEAELASGGCTPEYEHLVCGPELSAGQCCYVAFVYDYGCEGRPYRIDGHAVVADAIERGDWGASAVPATAQLSDAQRRRIGARWQQAALGEHASIAAFSRFVLDLLALGAPVELVASAHGALADEVTHARLAFGLASAYLGVPVGPGPLAPGPTAGARGLAEIVRDAIVEGCIGETISAARAERALLGATDSAVRRVLSVIARDETRHAALAWRFVAWALREHPELRETIEMAFAEAAIGPAGGTTDPDGAALRAHGIVPDDDGRVIANEAITALVLPTARALVHDGRRAA